MQLEFNYVNGRYEAEFITEGDFNLHIEREDVPSCLEIRQRTSQSGGFALVKDVGDINTSRVFDYDFTALVYPKTIKIVSEVEPTLAIVTFAQ